MSSHDSKLLLLICFKVSIDSFETKDEAFVVEEADIDPGF